MASTKDQEANLPQSSEVPVLPLRDVVVYPHMVIPLFVGREKSIQALDSAMQANKQILLVAQKSAVRIPFNGKDLNNWEVRPGTRLSKSKWTVGVAAIAAGNPKMLVSKSGSGEMINLAAHHGESFDLFCRDKFGDARIEVELMVPQGSNSGVYVMGEYEIQVLDSWGRKKMGGGDMGAVYGAAPPAINASKKPGEWQKYVIDINAPRYDAGGGKIANARLVKVQLNGKVLHENVMLSRPTPGGVSGKEAAKGPIMFQGNHGAVALRNIRITEFSDVE